MKWANHGRAGQKSVRGQSVHFADDGTIYRFEVESQGWWLVPGWSVWVTSGRHRGVWFVHGSLGMKGHIRPVVELGTIGGKMGVPCHL